MTVAAEPRHAFLRVEEAAKVLRIGRTLAYEMAADGRLPVIRVGKQLRVPRRKFEEQFGLEEAKA